MNEGPSLFIIKQSRKFRCDQFWLRPILPSFLPLVWLTIVGLRESHSFTRVDFNHTPCVFISLFREHCNKKVVKTRPRDKICERKGEKRLRLMTPCLLYWHHHRHPVVSRKKRYRFTCIQSVVVDWRRWRRHELEADLLRFKSLSLTTTTSHYNEEDGLQHIFREKKEKQRSSCVSFPYLSFC